jgi:hypothetical protein
MELSTLLMVMIEGGQCFGIGILMLITFIFLTVKAIK